MPTAVMAENKVSFSIQVDKKKLFYPEAVDRIPYYALKSIFILTFMTFCWASFFMAMFNGMVFPFLAHYEKGRYFMWSFVFSLIFCFTALFTATRIAVNHILRVFLLVVDQVGQEGEEVPSLIPRNKKAVVETV